MAEIIGEKEGQAKRLGEKLRSKRDKVFGGLKIARAGGNERIAKWRVFQTEPKNDEKLRTLRTLRTSSYPTRNLEKLDAISQVTPKSENKPKICELSVGLYNAPQSPQSPHENADENDEVTF